MFPGSPGFWRRIRICPSDGVVTSGLEDEFHRFILRLRHHDGILESVETKAERYPWSPCPGAGEHLANQSVGRDLKKIAELNPYEHCTHLMELLVLSATHAEDSADLQYDIWASDRVDGCKFVALFLNDDEILRWQLEGTRITGPNDWAGRDLRQLASWKASLDSATVERVLIMRRVAQMSDGRSIKAKPDRPTDHNFIRIGACFTYQPQRVDTAQSTENMRHDFADSLREPLHGFDPAVF